MAGVYNWMRILRDNLFPFERGATRGELIFFRIFEALIGVWTLDAVWSWAPSIAHYEVVVLPLGLANYLDVSVLFKHDLIYVLAGVLTGSVLLGFTRRTRWAYTVALVLFHFVYVARYSFGKASHGSHLVGVAILALALGTAMFRTRAGVYRFVFGALFFFYGLGYTSAAFCKLIATGIHWPAGEHLILWVGERTIDMMSSYGAFEPNVFQRAALAYPIVGSVGLTFGLVAEFSGVLMWFERARPYVLTALMLMHVGVELLLNIFFAQNIYILLLLAYPWARGIDWVLTRRARQQELAASGM